MMSVMKVWAYGAKGRLEVTWGKFQPAPSSRVLGRQRQAFYDDQSIVLINIDSHYSLVGFRTVLCYLTSHLLSSEAPTTPLWLCGAMLRRSPSIGFCLVKIRGVVHAEEPPVCFVIVSNGSLSGGYWHDGLGVCLGDGQTQAEGSVARWIRRRPPSVYARIPDLICFCYSFTAAKMWHPDEAPTSTDDEAPTLHVM